MLQRSSARYVALLYVADLVLTLCALLAARWLRIIVPWGRPLDVDGALLRWPMFLLAALIWSLTLTALKVYDPQRLAHPVDELQATIAAIATATLILAGALYFSYRGLSRLLFVYFFILDGVFCVTARLLLRRLFGGLHRAPRRVLIVGAGSVGQRVAHSLRDCAWMGIQVVGYVDEDAQQIGQLLASYAVLDTIEHSQEVIARHGVQEVVIALALTQHARLASIVAALQDLPVNIKVVPDYSELTFLRATMEQLGGMLFVGLKEPVIGPIDRAIKRGLDLVLAILGMVLLSPLLAWIALLVAVSSPGPILYRSRRVGEGGQEFNMLKFRTMVVDADKQEQGLISETTDGKLAFDKRVDDPRVTPIGRFLRRYSLDELPQLLNVLRGEMSAVGPRPELPALVAYYDAWQRKRFSVPQGITGWWQISGRGNKPKYLHAEDDLYYIRNYSLLLDLQILWRTFGAVIKGTGAF